MERIVEKHFHKLMCNHPELTKEEALAITERLVALSKIVIDSYKKSSNDPRILAK